MALYLTEHRHTAETCPTKNREMMLMLGQHVSQENADKFGIRILSDIVHPGEHWMNMVLEADDRSRIEEFMKPFGMVGSVSIKEVKTCEEVVASATC
jgi:uncharacterized protein with GYD domain